MPSERTQRQIDRLLDEAEQAIARRDWALLRQHALDVLRLNPSNEDALAFLAASERPAEFPLTKGGGEGEAVPEGAGFKPALPGLQHQSDATAGATTPGPLPNPPLQGEGTGRPASFAAGRYVVKRFLGEGGKKRVYLAHDTTLDRDVAFALIKVEGLDDTARERISREAQAMGRLGSHPHIVTVFDLGTEVAESGQWPVGDADSLSLAGEGESEGEGQASAHTRAAPAHGSQPYMVTELMGGGDVEGAIEQAPEHKLPLAQALAIAEQVCQGLEFAHNKGIVHRDLKPGNVWLTEHLSPGRFPSGEGETPVPSPRGGGLGRGHGGGGEAVAKIGDFGLAVAIDRTRLTQAGMMVGTVSYMPPEQATGGEVTPQSDLYSLGAMLYELVTGRPPFVGDEAVAIIGQHLNTPPVAPTWHRPACPPGLEALILRLLEKDPSKRPASAGEVGEALGRILRQAQDEREQRAMGRGGGPLSLASSPPLPLGKGWGEGSGEGEAQAGVNGRAALDNPLYRRVFVGRESELRQLQAAYDAALSGRGSLAMVVGEPGIGKTSVCEQLATYAALRGGKALVGHCYEEGSLSVPYLPFVEAMRSYVLAREPNGLRSDLGSGAGEVARIVSEVRDRVQVTPADSGDAEEQRWRLLQAISGFLRNASQVQPLLIILEDLHDADRGTLDLLVHLSRNLEGARLLIVGTYRDVEVDRGHPLSSALAELRRGQNFQRVPLRGLTAEEVQRMVASVSQRHIPWPFAELVHRQTEGNPLFVQEMLRYLVEEGLVSEQGGSLRRVGDDSLAGRIPEGLRDVIGKRLSRLADKTNQVLSIASVVGREFRLDVLQAVANLPQEDVETALEEAGNIAVVEQRTGVGGQLSFRFTHAFFRQTLYEELFAARRIRLHQQVARALETVYGRRVDEHAAELAEHYSNSSDPGDLGKAVEYGKIAATRAMGVFAYGEAARHFEDALKAQDVLDPDNKLKRCDLLLALGEALMPAGEPRRVSETVAPEAVTLAETLGDRDRASLACELALNALFRHGAARSSVGPEWRQWAEQADRFASPDTHERAHADRALGWALIHSGRLREGWALNYRALALAREIEDLETLFSAPAIFAVTMRPQDLEEGKRVAEDIAARPRGGVAAGLLLLGLWNSGVILLSCGEWERANELWSQMAELETQTREVTFGSWVRDIWLAALEGRLEEAVALAPAKLAEAEAAGVAPSGRAATDAAAFRARIYVGRADDALATLEDALAAGMPEIGLTGYNRPLLLAYLGRRQEAADELRHRIAERRIAQGEDEIIVVLAGLLEAAVLIEDRESAALLAGRLQSAAGVAASSAADLPSPVARHLGAGAALLGKHEQALRYSEQALDLATRMRHRPEVALARLQIAELLLAEADGSRPEALAHLDFAIAEFREMKMQPSLERALRHKDVLKA